MPWPMFCMGGWGRGWRWWYRATGLPRWMRWREWGYGYPPYIPYLPKLRPEDELKMLEAMKDDLEAELEDIKKRIEDLRKET